MTLHRIKILYTIFVDTKWFVLCGLLQNFYDYIHTDVTDVINRPNQPLQLSSNRPVMTG